MSERPPRPTWTRDVRLLAASRGISMAGAEAGYIAILALAWELTGSAAQASMVLLASVVARTVGAPFAGWIGDHVDRRRVIVASELVIAAAMTAMAFAQSIPQLVVALFVVTFAASTCGSALDAAVGSLVPAEDLPAANSTLGVARTAGHMLGPVLGGIAVATVGARGAFLVDAASSLVAGLIVLGIAGCVGGGARDHARGEDGSEVVHDRSLLAGMHTIAGDPVLRLLIASWMAMSVAFAFITAAELPLAVAFGVDEAGLGAIVSSWCAGSLLGAWLARRVDVVRRGARVLVANAAIAGVVFAATGIAPAFWCVLVLMAIGGFSMALAGVVESSVMQVRIEDDVKARTFAAFHGCNSLVWGTNLALAGVFVEAFSAGAAYVYAGAWCLVGAVGFVGVARVLRRERIAADVQRLRPRAALESDLSRGA